MRADRLMNIMILLQNRGKMTVKELSDELEVSDRTILRDMDALTNAGIPIVSERGKHGGWRLLDHFRSRLSGLTMADMQSLFLSPSRGILEDLGLNNHSLDTRQKLFASIPEKYRNEAQAMWERIYIDTDTWRQAKENVSSLKSLQYAVWENKKLTIHYEKANGEQTERMIDPLGLVAKGNKWYLVAARNGEFRNYRVSRIQTAQVESETFARPASFNLASYWEQSKKEFIEHLPTYEVNVELDPTIIKRIQFTSKFVETMDVGNSSQNQWASATLRFNDKAEAIEFILGFANKIKVLAPNDLQDQVVSLAKSVIEFYDQQ